MAYVLILDSSEQKTITVGWDQKPEHIYLTMKGSLNLFITLCNKVFLKNISKDLLYVFVFNRLTLTSSLSSSRTLPPNRRLQWTASPPLCCAQGRLAATEARVVSGHEQRSDCRHLSLPFGVKWKYGRWNACSR